MKISKTDLTKVIKEELSAFYVTPDAFAKEKQLDNTPPKPLQERKFLVKLADIGDVIVDGQSEGEIRTRLSKKLRAGKKDIISISKLAKGKADMASKKLGIEPDSYDSRGADEKYGIPESAINEAHPKQVAKMFQKKQREVIKLLNIIKQSLGFLDKRHNGDPGNTENLMILTTLHRSLADAEQVINKFPRK
jgi:hypothetical protein